MDSSQQNGETALHLYVREELPPPASERAETVGARGRALAEAGVVDGFHETRWPKRVPLEDCGCDLRDVYLAFAGWAADAGVSLQPFFQTRVCFGPESGERSDWLVLPAIALAVVAGDDVLAVYPHASDGETATVEDGLEAVEGVGDHEELVAADPRLLAR